MFLGPRSVWASQPSRVREHPTLSNAVLGWSLVIPGAAPLGSIHASPGIGLVETHPEMVVHWSGAPGGGDPRTHEEGKMAKLHHVRFGDTSKVPVVFLGSIGATVDIGSSNSATCRRTTT